MPANVANRSWSALTEAERDALIAAYQPVLDGQSGTCSFASKLAHMQLWLAGHGVTISEDEIRGRRPDGSEPATTDNSQRGTDK